MSRRWLCWCGAWGIALLAGLSDESHAQGGEQYYERWGSYTIPEATVGKVIELSIPDPTVRQALVIGSDGLAVPIQLEASEEILLPIQSLEIWNEQKKYTSLNDRRSETGEGFGPGEEWIRIELEDPTLISSIGLESRLTRAQPELIELILTAPDGSSQVIGERDFERMVHMRPRVLKEILVRIESQREWRLEEVTLWRPQYTPSSSRIRHRVRAPGEYRVFVSPVLGASPTLLDAEEIWNDSSSRLELGQLYHHAGVSDDADGDGRRNGEDLCPLLPSPENGDQDGNGVGDACQDSDGDLVYDLEDNCPRVSNRGQADEDQDAIGDLCEEDSLRETLRRELWIWLGGIWISMMLLRGGLRYAKREEKG